MKTWLVLAALVFLLSGCLEVKEEVWIREDGTARVRTVMRISATATALMQSVAGAQDPFEDLEESILQSRDDPRVLSASVQQETDEDVGRTITIDTEFKSFRSLEGAFSRDTVNQGSEWTRDCWFTRVPEGRQRIILRLARSAVDKQRQESMEASREMYETMAEGAGYTFRLHAPGLAEASAGGQLLEDGSMEWKFPGVGLMFDPEGIEIQAVFDAPRSALERMPTALKILLLMLIFGGGIGGYLFFTRKSRGRARTAPPKAPPPPPGYGPPTA